MGRGGERKAVGQVSEHFMGDGDDVVVEGDLVDTEAGLLPREREETLFGDFSISMENVVLGMLMKYLNCKMIWSVMLLMPLPVNLSKALKS